jgi:hypothetical protein
MADDLASGNLGRPFPGHTALGSILPQVGPISRRRGARGGLTGCIL